MGRGIAIATCLLLALAAPVAQAKPPPTKAAKRCATRGTTVAENSRARVYRLYAVEEAEYYGCYLRTGHTRFLAATGGGGSHYNALYFRLVGTRAGFVSQHSLDVDFDFAAYSVDLRRGRVVRKLEQATGDARDFAMTRSGSFAVLKQPEYGSSTYEITAVDSSGTRTLDSGGEIDPRSLAVADGRVYWMHGDQPRSAALP